MIKEGDKAPAFTLPDETGKKISLKEFKGKKVILYFYPKALTPGCTQESCDFRDALSSIKKKKTVVFGVSRDSVERQLKFKEKYDLNFPLLSDESGEVCKAYGVWKEKSLYGRKFMGIERTTFVIDGAGKIEKIFTKVKVKGHSDAVMETL